MASTEDWYCFWSWFARGSGGRRGCERLLSLWCFVDLITGSLSLYLINKDLEEIAKILLIPLSGIFMGVVASVTVGMHQVISSDELSIVASQKKGGIADYVFCFQMTILCILVSVVYWSAAACGLFEGAYVSGAAKFIGFSLLCFCVRLVWGCVNDGSFLIFASYRMKSHSRSSCLSD